jgi:hypothetical protein
MLGLASPSALEGYKSHIRKYANSSPISCWALLYQSDTRARRELAGRIRMQGRNLRPQTPDADGLVYDPSMPWEYVFRKTPLAFHFWHWEFEHPAFLLKNGAADGRYVSGEAPIGSRPANHLADPQGSSEGPARPNAGSKQPRKNAGRSRSRNQVAGERENNNKGRQLCHAYQSGNCTSNPCPKGYAHQCSLCLDNRHGSNTCPRKDNNKGGGKSSNKGAGKGGKGGSRYHG